MRYDDSFIQAYLQESPLSKEPFYKDIRNYQKPDIKRKDIVEELNTKLSSIVNDFPVFNQTLWNMLFSDKESYLDTICILPVVGSDTMSTRVLRNDETYILIDLICVANYTRVVSQMVYILKNHITFEVTKLCILKQYPLSGENYAHILNASAFINGLAHYLSWNESCELYKFYTEKYEPHKEKAFGLLTQAMTIDNRAMQQKIIKHIRSSELWDQFPAVAGMFYFDDIYRELGKKGIKQLYAMGPKNFIAHIFEQENDS
ncbi:hypothetical protein ACWG0P_03675 [Amedibacillus sp. YH-ame6]